MCNQTNYLLKGDAAQSLADFLCTNLNDTQLEELFVLISSQLDITKAKQIVIEALQDDITLYFFDNLVKLSSAFRTLNSRFANMLPLNGFRSLQSVYNEITNIDLEKTISTSLLGCYYFKCLYMNWKNFLTKIYIIYSLITLSYGYAKRSFHLLIKVS